VQIKLHTIIYELIEQVEESMEGLLEPESKEAVIGHAEVRKDFRAFQRDRRWPAVWSPTAGSRAAPA
jgi:translation initiation factor IF-2